MEFRVLGPLEVVRDGDPIALGGDKQRALLALLLLHRREVISNDRLIDELWDEQPPPASTKTLHVYVSRLRKVLGDGVLETRGHGYRLAVPAEAVDADRFEELVVAAREAEPARARSLLEEALGLWRGPPLADVAFERFAETEIARLEELRLVAQEELVDVRLELGEHRELVPELEALARTHPVRERLAGQLMLALYRSGAQGDALEVYRRTRMALVERLGVEPGPRLRRLEQQVLEQDPGLDAPRERKRAPATATGATRGGHPAMTGRRRQGRLLVGAGCVVLGAVVAALLLTAGGEDPEPTVTLRAGSVGVISPATGEVAAALALGGSPVRMAADGTTLWIGNDRSRSVAAVDIRLATVARTLAPDAHPTDVAAYRGTLWILDRERRALLQVGRGYDRVTRRTRVPGAPGEPFLRDRVPPEPWSVAAGETGAWVTDGSRRLLRVGNDGSLRSIDVKRPVGGVAVGAGAVWAISHRPPSVLRIAASSGAVKDRIPISGRRGYASPYPVAVDVGGGSVWVLNANTGTVSRIDPDLQAVSGTYTVGVEHVPVRLAVGAGATWVAGADGTLTRIDLRSGEATTTVVADTLGDLAVAGGRVWVTTGRSGAGTDAAPEREAVATGGVEALPPAFCSPVYTAPGTRPSALVASDMPLQGNFAIEAIQITTAVRLVMRERAYRAGRQSLGLQTCDHSTTGSEFAIGRKCLEIAKAYARNRSVVGVVGPFTSACAGIQLATLNGARPGPLASVAPSTTYLGLTRRGVGTFKGEPEVYRPSGRPSFARMVPADDVQGVALAQLAEELGLRRVFVLDTRDAYALLLSAAFRHTSEALGHPVAGTARYSLRSAARNARVPALVRRARPDGVFVPGYLVPATAALLRDLRRALGPEVPILLPDGFVSDFLADELGPEAEGLLLSQPGPALSGLPSRGRRFVEAFRREVGTAPTAYALYAAQATEVLLDAIARSDGTRPSVARELFRTRVTDGLMPDFTIGPTGDTSLTNVTIFEVRDGRLRVLRDVTPPPTLVDELRRP